jgi:hypothetical protein
MRKVLSLQITVLLLLVYPFVSATFRDNDQASILSGAWPIAQHQSPFFHAVLYNFDKQWGTFLALIWLFRAFPHANPVLSANVQLTVLVSLAWVSLGLRMGRTRSVPFSLVLPFLLVPALILYMPYLGSGWLSLAFVLLAFFFVGNVRSKVSLLLAMLAIGTAAACRADAILAVPSLAISQMPPRRLATIICSPLLWLLGSAAALPVCIGKMISAEISPVANPLSFDVKRYLGLLLFGMAPASIVLVVTVVILFSLIAVRKPRFRLFYLSLAFTPLIPLAFYSLQLYGLRYLFLPWASFLFVVSSRRSVWIYRSLSIRFHWAPAALMALTVLPWIVGFKVPLTSQARLTVANPTLFPTGDGRFPMAAYLGFQRQVLLGNSQIDHNQKIWLAAKSVNYQSCDDRTVSFLITPMSNFIELAIRLQNKYPRPINSMSESPCGIAYVDVRSIMRGYRRAPRDGNLFQDAISLNSIPGNGETIARIDSNGKQTEEGRTLKILFQTFGPRQVEIFLAERMRIALTPGLRYAIFSSQPCQVTIEPEFNSKAVGDLIQATWMASKEGEVEATCSGKFAGWAKTTLPPYMGL